MAMDQQDKEALFMIVQRNGSKEVRYMLDQIVKAINETYEKGYDPYDIDLGRIE